jgi:oligopeptide/dipeptide ABC transporter ATP-binding protein
LEVIPGSVPNLVNLPPGCRFAPRCRARTEHALSICTEKEPELITYSPKHTVRCWLYQDADGHNAPLK